MSIISRNPIENVKSIHFESLLFKVTTEKYGQGSKSLQEKKFAVLQILSVETFRPNDSRTGIIVEGIVVNHNGDQLPGNSIVRDIALPFDQTSLKFAENIWTDDEELAMSLAEKLNADYSLSAKVEAKEYADYVEFLESLIKQGA